MESGLNPGSGAGRHVFGDLAGTQAGRPGRPSVGEGRPQRGGVRTDGAVTEQVTGRARGAQGHGGLDSVQLGPVAHHLDRRPFRAQPAFVEAAGRAPGRVEPRLHRGDDPAGAESNGIGDEFGVFQPMPG